NLLCEMGYQAVAPYSGTEYSLETGMLTVYAEGKPIDREKAYKAGTRANLVYKELVAEAEKLLRMVKERRGCPNKENAKLTSQIRALIQKWKD
ncbi:MAG: MBL fold metallo-hydrolase, partial [Clostridia bacterium]|nr:MBL fold metallo-hydrolase [Clostridia bacterium]